MKRLRLLKVVVQPVFVLDDGESLTEHPQPAHEVKASDWPAFPALLEEQRQQTEQALDDPAPSAHSGRLAPADVEVPPEHVS